MARWEGLILAVAIGAVAIAATGCSPRNVELTPDEEGASLESLCERSLQELAALIAAKTAEAGFPPDVLAEARALRAAAAELYIDGHSETALDLIDEAFALIRNRK